MITLWHVADARSFRPLWLLEELGLPYRLELLPFPPRFAAPGFLELNPLGTVPYLTDGAVTLTESTAMLHWLAGRADTPLSVQPSEPDYAAWLNWLYQSDATFTFPLTLVLRYRMLEPAERRQPQVAEDYARWFLNRMRHVERQLDDGRQWLAAGRFTIADIAVGYACLLARANRLFDDLGPRTQAWFGRCQAREGYQRARAAQQAGLSPLKVD